MINLSNFDYPIKSNAVIYNYLSQPQRKDKNWISYWSDTTDLAERFYRVHIGTTSHSLYHPSESGIISPPYPRWKHVKHHQWIILTRDCINFFRIDSKALNFLAFAEHTYIPDESYFATGFQILIYSNA